MLNNLEPGRWLGVPSTQFVVIFGVAVALVAGLFLLPVERWFGTERAEQSLGRPAVRATTSPTTQERPPATTTSTAPTTLPPPTRPPSTLPPVPATQYLFDMQVVTAKGADLRKEVTEINGDRYARSISICLDVQLPANIYCAGEVGEVSFFEWNLSRDYTKFKTIVGFDGRSSSPCDASFGFSVPTVGNSGPPRPSRCPVPVGYHST